ncbi:hypothetical protein AU476_31350 [Cupriavidus sp. UYMSc13B]|nr:hypothetical protein AU476_01330 [Cupriavidus sp. UYMSc13B]RWA48974.1 hypothetical protein AU476_31350 [Cupriavidus sp. UYMSc13B]
MRGVRLSQLLACLAFSRLRVAQLGLSALARCLFSRALRFGDCGGFIGFRAEGLFARELASERYQLVLQARHRLQSQFGLGKRAPNAG